MFKARAASIKYQSRPKRVDMTARVWGDLTAIRPGNGHYWWMRCGAAGHVVLVNGAGVRSAARQREDGAACSYFACPECKRKTA